MTNMKSIRTKMILVVCLLIASLLLIVGGTVTVMMYQSSITSLEKTMGETANVAAELVYESMLTYEAAAQEIGATARLSDPDISISEKKKIINERIKQYGFLAGNIADTKGKGVLYDIDIADRDYFIAGMKGEATISNVLLSRSLNKYVLIVAAPLWQGGVPNSEVVGVIYFNVDAVKLSDVTNKINVGDTGSAYMLDKDNYTIAHQDSQRVTGRDNTRENFKTNPKLESLNKIENKMTAGESGFGIYSYDGVKKLLAFAPVQTGQGWSIAVNAELNEFLQSTFVAIYVTIGLVVLSIIIGIVASVLLANSITNPVVEIEAAAVKMAMGDYDVTVSYKSNDELGSLAQSMREMIDMTKSVLSDLSRGLDEISRGNFDIAPAVEYVGVFEKIKLAMVKIIFDLSGTMSQIKSATDQVASGSEQVASGSQALAQGATEQASSIEELSASINEVSQQIMSNAKNTSSARSLAGKVGAEIDTSNRQMSEMIDAMTEISVSSSKISKIIKTIEDIAFQTNILALNAAVEAARAGEAGKGFAVVADEVRNLANKSSDAAKQTNLLIDGSVKSVENGVEIANSTAASLSGVVTGANQIVELIAKISDASDEQSTAISQINLGIEQISSVVQTNSATSEESAAASEELNGQASIMKGLVGKFQLKSDGIGLEAPLDFEQSASAQYDYENTSKY